MRRGRDGRKEEEGKNCRKRNFAEEKKRKYEELNIVKMILNNT